MFSRLFTFNKSELKLIKQGQVYYFGCLAFYCCFNRKLLFSWSQVQRAMKLAQPDRETMASDSALMIVIKHTTNNNNNHHNNHNNDNHNNNHTYNNDNDNDSN